MPTFQITKMAKQGYDIIYPNFMSKCKQHCYAQMWENLGV